MKNLILLGFALLMNSAPAQTESAPSVAFRQWTVTTETADPYLGVPSCRVATDAVNPKVPFQFSLSFPKGHVKAPVAMITLGPDVAGQKVELKLSSSQTEMALPLKNQMTGEGQAYWYIPLDLDFLIERIIKGSVLEISVQLVDRSETLKVSLSGSGAALKEAAKCLEKEELYQADFFTALNDPAIAPLAVEGEPGVSRLQELFQTSYGFYFQRQRLESQLAQLKLSNDGSLLQEQEAQVRASVAAELLGEARNQLLALDLKIQEQRTVLEQSKSQALQAKSNVAQAQQTLDSNRARYEPLKKQLHAYEDSILRSKQAVEALVDQSIAVQEAIDVSSSTLSTLQAEGARLDARVAADQNGLAQSKADQTRLSAELAGFNLEGKLRERVQNDARVQTLNSEVASLRLTLKDQETVMRQTQKEMIGAQRDFERCRQQSSDVAAECSVQMSVLQKAQGRFNESQGLVRQTNGTISRKEGESRAIQQAARAELASRREGIQNALNLAVAQIETFEKQITDNGARLKELRGVEIPGADASLKSGLAQKNELEKNAAAAATKLEEAVNALENFKIEQKYVEVESAYVRAGQELERVNALSQAADGKVALTESELASQIRSRPSAESFVAEKVSVKTQMDVELKTTQQSLSGMKAKEAQLLQDIQRLQEQQEVSMRQYRYVLFAVLSG